jgi:hypothetical protein
MDGSISLCGEKAAGFPGLQTRAEQNLDETKCRAWDGGVVEDRRVGSEPEISRETRRGQNGVQGRKARRAAGRESERPE